MKKVEKFVKWIDSEKTKKSYRTIIKKYFDFLKLEPDKYFDSNRDYDTDLREYSLHIRNRYAPGSQKTMLNIIKNFLADNRVIITKRVWKQIHTQSHLKGDVTVIEEKIPDNSELKQILQHGGVKERALFLANATSSERIQETLSLTFDNFQGRHIIIQAGTAKKRYRRHTFITQEARETIDGWLQVRTDYIRKKFIKSGYVRESYAKEGYKFEKIKDTETWRVHKDGKEIDFDTFIDIIAKEDKRVFPFSYPTAILMWNRMLENAGHPFNEKDDNPQLQHDYYKYHIHTLRKFCKTQMMSTQINKNHLDAIVGHKNSMDKIYAKFRPEVLQKSYDDYCNCLAIFSDMNLIDSEYKPKILEHDKQIDTFFQQLSERDNQISNLEQRIKNMESRRSDEVAKFLLNNPEGIEKLRGIMHDLLERERSKKA